MVKLAQHRMADVAIVNYPPQLFQVRVGCIISRIQMPQNVRLVVQNIVLVVSKIIRPCAPPCSVPHQSPPRRHNKKPQQINRATKCGADSCFHMKTLSQLCHRQSRMVGYVGLEPTTKAL